jgi:simple sugar transport system permease protein/ribose transport system permease protein
METNESKNLNTFRRAWNAFDEKGIIIILIVMCIVLNAMQPAFGNVTNILNIFKQIAEIGIMAAGMTYVLISAEFDLSVGSNYGFCMVISGLLLQNSMPTVLAVIVPLLIGMGVGLVNGLMVTKVKIPAFIVTLSMLAILRGSLYVACDGKAVSVFPDMSIWFFRMGDKIGGVFPVQIIFLVAIFIVATFVLKKTIYGYKIFAVGGNAKTARLSGINVDKVKISAFMIMGAMSAVAAILGLAYMKSVHPSIGVGREMDVIAAVIIGGTALSGGKGSMVGTLIGASIMGVVRNGMVLLGVQAFFQEAFIGVVILCAVIGEKYISNRRVSIRK